MYTHNKDTTHSRMRIMQEMCVCASTSLHCKKHLVIYLWSASSLEDLKRVFELDLQSPKLPLQFKPQYVVCSRNKPINNGNPYNLPLWLFRDKTTTHIEPHNKIEATGYSTLQRDKKIKLQLQVFNLL